MRILLQPKDTDTKTISFLSRRSDFMINIVTMLFALGGWGLPMLLEGFRNRPATDPLGSFWALWIPFCCLTIPTIHYLCRRMIEMQVRINDLERRLNSSETGKMA